MARGRRLRQIRRRVERARGHAADGQALGRLLGWFFLGCLAGLVCGIFRARNIDGCTQWLEEARPSYGALLLQSLRFPVLLCMCAYARVGRRLSVLAMGLYGGWLCCVMTQMLWSQGFLGLLLAVQRLLFGRLLQLPLDFLLALRCRGLHRPMEIGWAAAAELAAVFALCALCAALDAVVTPVMLSFFLWLGK